MLKVAAQTVSSSMINAPPRSDDLDLIPNLNNAASPYTKNLEIAIPSTLSKLAPLRISIEPVHLKDVISLVQRKTTYPFAINLGDFMPKKGKRQIRYGRTIPATGDQVEGDIEIRFDPLDFLKVPMSRLKISEVELDPDELK